MERIFKNGGFTRTKSTISFQKEKIHGRNIHNFRSSQKVGLKDQKNNCQNQVKLTFSNRQETRKLLRKCGGKITKAIPNAKMEIVYKKARQS